MDDSPAAPLDAAGPLWQTIVIHMLGFAAALWTIRILSGWTTRSGSQTSAGSTVSRAYAIGATVAAYATVDAIQLALRLRVSADPTTRTSVPPDAELPYAIKLLITTALYEEATFAAIPAAAAGLAIALCARRWPIGPTGRYGILVACVVFGAVLRAMLHLYQSPEAAVMALGWGAASVLIYWRWRSIAGLVVVHSWYNSVALLSEGSHDWLLGYAIGSWVVLLAAAAVAMVYRRAPRADQRASDTSRYR
ncbi:hypothetical protein ACT17_11735 [Mycolicibacterium conceptionense]|jgi:hypothetical protein|uniref:CAAX prenyl protease 2/Lysostaphin resistance protein A-like domain-containing protein n=1 Tax=Mycolicibacterium conceptionense TaxID=451644 RepID=A0A0J8WYS4_9MYCO|nr:CPBP family intramembrane glutamic endopeptidase [Mycolicibacterium conceptionense]KMV18299.1 hypothetical protein ACT17_11735 [Mycolicibacterium conceptionense]